MLIQKMKFQSIFRIPSKLLKRKTAGGVVRVSSGWAYINHTFALRDRLASQGHGIPHQGSKEALRPCCHGHKGHPHEAEHEEPWPGFLSSSTPSRCPREKQARHRAEERGRTGPGR